MGHFLEFIGIYAAVRSLPGMLGGALGLMLLAAIAWFLIVPLLLGLGILLLFLPFILHFKVKDDYSAKSVILTLAAFAVSVIVGAWAFIAYWGPDFMPLWAAAMFSCVVAIPTLFFVVIAGRSDQ